MMTKEFGDVKFSTVEDLAKWRNEHCGKDCWGDAESPCILASYELHKEYVQRYGCICGGPCHLCRSWKVCFKTDEDKIIYFNSKNNHSLLK